MHYNGISKITEMLACVSFKYYALRVHLKNDNQKFIAHYIVPCILYFCKAVSMFPGNNFSDKNHNNRYRGLLGDDPRGGNFCG